MFGFSFIIRPFGSWESELQTKLKRTPGGNISLQGFAHKPWPAVALNSPPCHVWMQTVSMEGIQCLQHKENASLSGKHRVVVLLPYGIQTTDSKKFHCASSRPKQTWLVLTSARAAVL